MEKQKNKTPSKKRKSGKRSILDDPLYRDVVLDRIRTIGKETKEIVEGICSLQNHIWRKHNNTEYAALVAQARRDFVKLLWRDNPELKLKAIKALEDRLEGETTTWEKTYTSPDGRVSTDVTVVKRPAAKWAIEHALGLTPDGKSRMTGEDDDDGEIAIEPLAVKE